MGPLAQPSAARGAVRALTDMCSGLLRGTVPVSSTPSTGRTRSIFNDSLYLPSTQCAPSPSTKRTSNALLPASTTLRPRFHVDDIDGAPIWGLPLRTQVWRKRPPPDWRSISGRSISGRATQNDATAVPGMEHESRPLSKAAEHKCNCWKCDALLGCREFFCACGAAQPLDGGRVDYFEMFDIDKSVFLDAKKLEKNFKNMQRAFHPDLFANKSPEEQEISSTNSSIANKAYQTLSKPMQRVKYLMRVLGSSALEEEGAAADGPPVPPDFLMEVMETREKLEHCSCKEEAEGVLLQARREADECLQAMDEALKAGGGKEELADAAIRLRYTYRIEEEARRVVHKFEDEEHSKTSTADRA